MNHRVSAPPATRLRRTPQWRAPTTSKWVRVFGFVSMTNRKLSRKLGCAGKKMPELSDQEILSCSRPFGNHGCIGGNMEKSYHYISKHVLCSPSRR